MHARPDCVRAYTNGCTAGLMGALVDRLMCAVYGLGGRLGAHINLFSQCGVRCTRSVSAVYSVQEQGSTLSEGTGGNSARPSYCAMVGNSIGLLSK